MKNLKVIFRIETGGDILAIFPEVPGTNEYDVSSYAHIGQHGACSIQYYQRNTRPANPEQSASLLRELKSIYETGPDAVKLIPAIRFYPSDFAKRQAEMKRA